MVYCDELGLRSIAAGLVGVLHVVDLVLVRAGRESGGGEDHSVGVVGARAAEDIGLAPVVLIDCHLAPETLTPTRVVVALGTLAAGSAISAGMVSIRRRPVAATMAVALATGSIALATGMVGLPLGSLSRSRLNLASPDRTQWAKAALDDIANHPITGTGPGQAQLVFPGPDGQELEAEYVHNEYVQTLAELGVPGLGLLLAFTASLVLATWRVRSSVPSMAVWAATVAGLVGLSGHAAFDFLWHIPALPLTAALLAGLAMAERAEVPATPSS